MRRPSIRSRAAPATTATCTSTSRAIRATRSRAMLFDGALKAGDSLTVWGPVGEFVLADNGRPLAFVACDTGFAPIKSLIEHAMAVDAVESLSLDWLATRPDGHYLANQCRAWAAAFDHFRYAAHIDADPAGGARRAIDATAAALPLAGNRRLRRRPLGFRRRGVGGAARGRRCPHRSSARSSSERCTMSERPVVPIVPAAETGGDCAGAEPFALMVLGDAMAAGVRRRRDHRRRAGGPCDRRLVRRRAGRWRLDVAAAGPLRRALAVARAQSGVRRDAARRSRVGARRRDPEEQAGSSARAQALRRLTPRPADGRQEPCPISSIACFRSAVWRRWTRRPSFGEASARAKALRASPDRPADCTIKVIFAANEQEAEELLSQVRETAPGLVDDE